MELDPQLWSQLPFDIKKIIYKKIGLLKRIDVHNTWLDILHCFKILYVGDIVYVSYKDKSFTVANKYDNSRIRHYIARKCAENSSNSIKSYDVKDKILDLFIFRTMASKHYLTRFDKLFVQSFVELLDEDFYFVTSSYLMYHYSRLYNEHKSVAEFYNLTHQTFQKCMVYSVFWRHFKNDAQELWKNKLITKKCFYQLQDSFRKCLCFY
jgi:hypothetical protein